MPHATDTTGRGSLLSSATRTGSQKMPRTVGFARRCRSSANFFTNVWKSCCLRGLDFASASSSVCETVKILPAWLLLSCARAMIFREMLLCLLKNAFARHASFPPHCPQCTSDQVKALP